MIKGIGIDSIEIDRVRRAMENPRFAMRVFTEEERVYLGTKGVAAAQSAAGLFAAKEAAVKALGTGFGKVRFGDVEVLHAPSGAPYLKLHGEAAQLVPGARTHISITHDQTKALAFCVIED